jgi:hypothetical protein
MDAPPIPSSSSAVIASSRLFNASSMHVNRAELPEFRELAQGFTDVAPVMRGGRF